MWYLKEEEELISFMAENCAITPKSIWFIKAIPNVVAGKITG
jgi:hypothetical protein